MRRNSDISTAIVAACGALWASSASAVTLTKSYKNQVNSSIVYTQIDSDQIVIDGPAFRVDFDAFLTPKLAFEVGYFNLNTSTGTTLLSGFEVASKWYPFSIGSEVSVSGDGVSIDASTLWNQYVLLGYRFRDLNYSGKRTSYSGFGYGAGVNWFVGKHLTFVPWSSVYLNFELSKDQLSTDLGKRLNAVNVLAGLGILL